MQGKGIKSNENNIYYIVKKNEVKNLKIYALVDLKKKRSNQFSFGK